jgi:hypothetical protein
MEFAFAGLEVEGSDEEEEEEEGVEFVEEALSEGEAELEGEESLEGDVEFTERFAFPESEFALSARFGIIEEEFEPIVGEFELSGEEF